MPNSSPAQQSAFPSAFTRRASAATSANASKTPATNISSQSSTPAGIPAFRSLRSLLPFAPNKQPTPISSNLSPAPDSRRSGTFVSFGAVRKSFQREKAPSTVVPPVIPAPSSRRTSSDSVLRRSVSCSTLDTPSLQDLPPSPHSEGEIIVDVSAPLKRPASLEPLVSHDLSTILEADTSGISRMPPSAASPRPRSPEDNVNNDNSFLDLSTANLTNEVIDTVEGDEIARRWIGPSAPVVIDATEMSDSEIAGLNVSTLDPDLAALLSPNHFIRSRPSAVRSKLPALPPRSPGLKVSTSPAVTPPSRLPRYLPSAPTSPASPSPSTAVSHKHPPFLGSNSSPVSITFPSRTPSSKLPVLHGSNFLTPTPSPGGTSITEWTAKYLPSPGSAASSTRRRKSSSSTSTLQTPPADTRATGSLDLPRPRTESRSQRPLYDDDPPSPLIPDSVGSRRAAAGMSTYRENNRARMSLTELSRRHNRHLHRRQNSDETDETARTARSGTPASMVLAHSLRERANSVHERAPSARSVGPGWQRFRRHPEADGLDGGANEFGEIVRSGSSLSGRLSASGRRLLTTEWLSPRTVKAFRAAGLTGNDDDLNSARAPGMIRSSSDYTQADAGGRGGLAPSPFGTMESPTYTASSGGKSASRERDRDTPLSASTAPTSVSGSSFPFGPGMSLRERERGRERSRDRGRDRGRERSRNREGEQDWEGDEIRDLRERHSTETGALLGALSDSQRMTRLLRRENEELRVRLEKLESMREENEELRRVVRELKDRVGELRESVDTDRRANGNPNRAGRKPALGLGVWRVPPRRSGLGTAVLYGRGDEEDIEGEEGGEEEPDIDEEFNEPPRHLMRRDRLPGTPPRSQIQYFENVGPLDDPIDLTNPVSSSTPVAPSRTHKRRFSTTSSILPSLPPNMTMLLHDNDYDDENNAPYRVASITSDFDSFRPLTTEVPVRRRGFEPSLAEGSLRSNGSHTTTDLSMASTASAQSLFLRPEHQVHLDDLKSLDLGRGPGEDMW